MQQASSISPSRFQTQVYMALLKELGNPWHGIERRIRAATAGKDILVEARIKEEISNLVSMCVRFENTMVFIIGMEGPPLEYGELYIHPVNKKLCIVGRD